MMQWVMQMARHPKAFREIQNAIQAIQPIMMDSQASRDEKRKALNMMVNELTEETLKLKPIAEQIVGIINMKEDVCREYRDSESQTDGILEWLPRMKEHRGLILDAVKRARKSFDLTD